jgi:phosphomannomutase
LNSANLKFGTSGLRGLAVELEGQAARRYTAAFLRRLADLGQEKGNVVFLGRDFRPSSVAILRDCAAAIVAARMVPVNCGAIPTPALALHAMEAGCASIMVTGSHIPSDRNGLKFYLPSGEISKADEAGILGGLREESIADWAGPMADEAGAAIERFFDRYAALLPAGALEGWRIGVFEHSTVARDLLLRLMKHFGAEAISLGRSEAFVAVDTEAFGDEVFAGLQGWVLEHRLDALVSADGDGDRPLLMDAKGNFVRGDVLGLITARYLGAQTVVTPVTSNSGIERTGSFSRVLRTRVGSPYVIESMTGAPGSVIGFEANGGTFVGNNVSAAGVSIPALPTRDAILPLLCVLGLAAGTGTGVDELVEQLPLHHALADRLQNVPPHRSLAFLNRLSEDDDYARKLFAPHEIANLSRIDGLKFRIKTGDTVHFRASGNAPELRCYVEGSTPEVALALLEWGVTTAAKEVA